MAFVVLHILHVLFTIMVNFTRFSLILNPEEAYFKYPWVKIASYLHLIECDIQPLNLIMTHNHPHRKMNHDLPYICNYLLYLRRSILQSIFRQFSRSYTYLLAIISFELAKLYLILLNLNNSEVFRHCLMKGHLVEEVSSLVALVTSVIDDTIMLAKLKEVEEYLVQRKQSVS